MEHGEHHVHEHGHDDEAQALPDGLVMDYVAPPNNIQRMGGLIHRIPVTAITMAIGGLSLAGFPFLTAGFWSKDEIIADAWHGMSQSNLPMFVFLALITAAILTAFYTARMWLMTFWGEARTVEAEHAGTGMLRNRWVNVWNRTRMGQEKPLEPEVTDREADIIAMQMEIPLIILAFFAIFAGFIFPVLPDFLNKTLLEELPEIDFNILPMLFSIIAALGGLFLGYFVYGMRPVRADEVDPLERSLGPGLWHALQMRFGMDLFYRRYVVGPFQWLASGKYFRRSAKLYAEAIVSTELLAKPDTAELAKTNATIQPGTRYPVLSWTRSRDWVRIDVKGKKDEFWVPTSSVTLIDEAGMVQDLSNYTISFVDALDKEVFDGTLHSIADAFIWLGEFFKRFNTVVIDGVGDGIPRAILDGARWFRQIQSGRIQQYLLIVALALLAIGTLFLLQVM
jgi:NADH:ubiquinone oxidoreductase subunit 5 (subunit L)/multisubunit Na+/H+ antiporter MnhA subunit